MSSNLLFIWMQALAILETLVHPGSEKIDVRNKEEVGTCLVKACDKALPTGISNRVDLHDYWTLSSVLLGICSGMRRCQRHAGCVAIESSGMQQAVWI